MQTIYLPPGQPKSPLNLTGPEAPKIGMGKCRKISLIILSIIFMMMGVAVAAIYYKLYLAPTPGKLVLEVTLNEMATNLKPDVDPCIDFYEYACGSFSEKYPVTEDASTIDYFTLESKKVREKLMSILKSDELLKDETHPPMKYVKYAWDSCINGSANHDSSMSRFISSTNSLSYTFFLDERVAEPLRRGFDVFFSLKVKPYPRSIYYSNVLSIDPIDLKFAVTGNTTNFSYLTQVIELMYPGRDRRSVEEFANEIMNFETELESVKTPPNRDLNDSKLKKIRVADLPATQSFKWPRFLNRLDNSSSWYEVYTQDELYIGNASRILSNSSSKFLLDYMTLKIFDDSCFFISDSCRRRQWKASVTGPTSETTFDQFVEDKCFKWLEDTSEDILLKIHHKSIDPYNFEVRTLINKTINQLQQFINQSTWMTEDTRLTALSTVAQVEYRSEVAVPWWMFSESSLDSNYNTSFHNGAIRDLLPVETYMHTKYLQRASDFKSGLSYSWPPKWPVSFLSAAPQLVLPTKSLYVPAISAFGHFFVKEFPVNMQYGLLGSLIASELSHSFDLKAHLFSLQSGQPLWSQNSSSNFSEIMQCLINLYDDQHLSPKVYPNLNAEQAIDGRFTFIENYADLIGVKTAFEAYKREGQTRMSYPSTLSGKSDDQVFFISHANALCANEEGRSSHDIYMSPFSPNRYRVNLPLSQMDEFARAFNCPVGTPMNPDEVCEIN